LQLNLFGVAQCLLFRVAKYKYIPTTSRIIFFLGSQGYPSHMKGYAPALTCPYGSWRQEWHAHVCLVFSFGKSQFLVFWFDSIKFVSYHRIIMPCSLQSWIDSCIFESYLVWFDSNYFHSYHCFSLTLVVGSVIWFTWLVNLINLHPG